jgi:hypothetical protein
MCEIINGNSVTIVREFTFYSLSWHFLPPNQQRPGTKMMQQQLLPSLPVLIPTVRQRAAFADYHFTEESRE